MNAYDVCYLEDMMKKTEYLFDLVARNCKDAFAVMEQYLRSDYRRYRLSHCLDV